LQKIFEKNTFLWKLSRSESAQKAKIFSKNIKKEQLGKRNRSFNIKSKNCSLKQKRFEKLLRFWKKNVF